MPECCIDIWVYSLEIWRNSFVRILPKPLLLIHSAVGREAGVSPCAYLGLWHSQYWDCYNDFYIHSRITKDRIMNFYTKVSREYFVEYHLNKRLLLQYDICFFTQNTKDRNETLLKSDKVIWRGKTLINT